MINEKNYVSRINFSLGKKKKISIRKGSKLGMFFDVQSPSIKEKMCHAQSQTLSIKCAYSMSEYIVLVVRNAHGLSLFYWILKLVLLCPLSI